MTLFDYCKEQLEKNPKIVDFEYDRKTYIKSELDSLVNITGTFEVKYMMKAIMTMTAKMMKVNLYSLDSLGLYVR